MNHQSHRVRRSVAALAVTVAGSASAFGLASATSYTFTTLDNQADPTFNQLLGINSHNVIAGYFGSSTPPTVHLNKGYLLNPPYGQTNYASENFPGSAQTQVIGIDNKSNTAGFCVNKAGTNRGFVEWNGVFESFTNPKTPMMKGSVNTTGRLLHSGHLTTYQHPRGSDTQAFGINDHDEIVGSYLDGAGVLHGFTLKPPLGPVSHWQTIDDPNGVGSSVVNGVNNTGKLVGFYTDAASNTDGMLATP